LNPIASENPGNNRDTAPHLRLAALAWVLLHVPIVLGLYASPINAAVHATPSRFRAALWPTFLPQAALLAAVVFVCALPFSPWPRIYRWAAPLLAGMGTAALLVDSALYAAVGFHMNGFFFRVLMQPNAIRETGIPMSEVAKMAAAMLACVIGDVLLGRLLIPWLAARIRSSRATWRWIAVILVASAAERVYGAALTQYGGSAVFAASTVLPLQPPVRMGTFLSSVLGKSAADPFAGADRSVRLPAGIAPESIALARRPDVIFFVAESLPHDHFDAETMPLLWARAAREGTVFTNHYAGSCATNYSVFTLLYGLYAHKLEATVGAGRQPVLFPALKHNGYQSHVYAASCVDWMDLKDTVFAGVQDSLETWCKPDQVNRDEEMISHARAWVSQAERDRPVFLFLFYFGTHFNYFYPERSARFAPAWDGNAGLKDASIPPALIERRSRNAAVELDQVMDEFLTWYEGVRGRKPLVVFTGDHGEEFRQKGHIGHGSDVTEEQIHVPFVVLGERVPVGRHDAPTSHADVVPTIFSLLGDAHPPALYADGQNAFTSTRDRFVLSTVGWEPLYAVVGSDLKVRMYSGGAATVTDPSDRPLADADQRLARSMKQVMRVFGHEPEDTPTRSANLAPTK
jgi:membrane-anchored protein YejM (alkaline phosphatase superfamily)